MSGHTPGPWRTDGRTIYALSIDGVNRFDCRVNDGWMMSGTYRTPEDEIESNVSLIAAAPDLLEALVATLKEFKEVVEGEWGKTDPGQLAFGDSWKLAEAAIAKATQP